MDHIHWFGMPGWRWLFILEGLPAVLLGIVTYFYLTDRPDDASWLTEEEKNWLNAELAREQAAKEHRQRHSALEVMKDGRVWHLALIYFTLVLGLYGIGFWMPTIIKDLSSVLTNT